MRCSSGELCGAQLSGDKRQLVPLIKAALLHPDFAFIDVISPCVAFNNHAGSTKSYEHTRGHTGSVVDADLIMDHEEITADYAPGTIEDVKMPDGTTLRLNKLDENYDPRDRVAALSHVQQKAQEGEVVTGLLYVDPEATDTHSVLNTPKAPLNSLTEAQLCPGDSALDKINAGLR